MQIKNQFPFRLGCTSYVYPDDILPNVRKMAPIVDDIEIVLFESEEFSNLPDASVINELCELAKEYDLSYTVHFPIDKKAGSADPKERSSFFGGVEKIIALTGPLNPYGYILHLEGITSESTENEIEQWQTACDDLCRKIAAIPNLVPQKICVENLFYPQKWHKDIVESNGFSFCSDIGHLWQAENNWQDILKECLPKTRIIHLHGVCDVGDHISLIKGKLDHIKKALVMLREECYTHVLSLEVFNEEDTFESLEMVGELWQKSH